MFLWQQTKQPKTHQGQIRHVSETTQIFKMDTPHQHTLAVNFLLGFYHRLWTGNGHKKNILRLFNIKLPTLDRQWTQDEPSKTTDYKMPVLGQTLDKNISSMVWFKYFCYAL